MRKPYQKPTLRRFGDVRELTLLLWGLKDSGGSDSLVGRLLPNLQPAPPEGTDWFWNS
jgi:hypothetical protein